MYVALTLQSCGHFGGRCDGHCRLSEPNRGTQAPQPSSLLAQWLPLNGNIGISWGVCAAYLSFWIWFPSSIQFDTHELSRWRLRKATGFGPSAFVSHAPVDPYRHRHDPVYFYEIPTRHAKTSHLQGTIYCGAGNLRRSHGRLNASRATAWYNRQRTPRNHNLGTRSFT